MRLYLIVAMCILSINTTHAEITKQDELYLKQKQRDLQEFKKDVQGFQYALPQSQQQKVDESMNDIKSNVQEQQPDKGDKLLYFVSFSIPDNGLIEIVKDAKSYGFTPIIRGLINNDYAATAKKVFELTKTDKDFGVAIDPFYYKQFNIKAVPAMVIQCKSGYDVIYGSLPIKDDLKNIAKNGQCKKDAELILSKG